VSYNTVCEIVIVSMIIALVLPAFLWWWFDLR
jgi:hypothetical protein